MKRDELIKNALCIMEDSLVRNIALRNVIRGTDLGDIVPAKKIALANIGPKINELYSLIQNIDKKTNIELAVYIKENQKGDLC